MVKKIDRNFETRAFLLRSVAYGDTHRILSFLSAENERVDTIAFSAKNSHKRFSGILDFLFCLRIEIKSAKHGDLHQLRACELEESFEPLKTNYQLMFMALHWIRLVDRVLLPGQNIAGLFDLLCESLRQLEAKSLLEAELLFYRQLLCRLGYHLELTRCTRCHSTRAEGFSFVAQAGGLLCRHCYPLHEDAALTQPLEPDFWDFAHPQNPEQILRRSQARLFFAEAFQTLLNLCLHHEPLPAFSASDAVHFRKTDQTA